MIAITCTSWTVSRNRTNVIHTSLEPWGVQTPAQPYSIKCIAALESGNLQFSRLLQLLRDLQRYHVPWILENPASSNLWHVAEVEALVNHTHA